MAAQNDTKPKPVTKAKSASTITREQGDAILDELRQIHRLLEANSRVAAVPKPVGPAPKVIRMPVPSAWYSIGREDAPVTIVEFTDYQCPFCRRFHTDSFPELKKQYIDTGKVRFVTRDVPLTIHANALQAAEAARCAGEQGEFWQMRDSLISHANDLSPDAVLRYAKDLQLDVEQLRACLRDEKYKVAVQKEAADAAALSISATPSFLFARTSPGELNGELIVGAMPLSTFDAAIKKVIDGSTSGASPDTARK